MRFAAEHVSDMTRVGVTVPRLRELVDDRERAGVDLALSGNGGAANVQFAIADELRSELRRHRRGVLLATLRRFAGSTATVLSCVALVVLFVVVALAMYAPVAVGR